MALITLCRVLVLAVLPARWLFLARGAMRAACVACVCVRSSWSVSSIHAAAVQSHFMASLPAPSMALCWCACRVGSPADPFPDVDTSRCTRCRSSLPASEAAVPLPVRCMTRERSMEKRWLAFRTDAMVGRNLLGLRMQHACAYGVRQRMAHARGGRQDMPGVVQPMHLACDGSEGSGGVPPPLLSIMGLTPSEM